MYLKILTKIWTAWWKSKKYFVEGTPCISKVYNQSQRKAKIN